MTDPRWETAADLIVVGSGVAGLTAALRARERGLRVLVVTKAEVTEGNTRLAQGGVAVVLPDAPSRDERGQDEWGQGDRGQRDSVEAHIADTVTAGAGLCAPAAVREIISAGPSAVTALRELGARFDIGTDGSLARTREGGHRAFRVIHAGGDATGAEISRALTDAARAGGLPVLERHTAVDLLRTPTGAVGGLWVLDADGVPGILRAPAVLLATGGFGQLYQATSNPELATGDGLALALRAGAVAADLEFVQFHPTVLFAEGATGRRPLITEAVRGEGAVLVDAAGAPVMTGVHPLGDLAPRDVVAKAISRRMAESGGTHVYLDATMVPSFRERFPTVSAACAAAGIDPRAEPIPVAPAAHFACGGLRASVAGRTELTGLYAAGEVARTGLHGANRLASNSLLEGMVVGRGAAEAVAADRASGILGDPRLAEVTPPPAMPIADRAIVQRLLSRHAAIGRDAAGLAEAAERIVGATVVRQPSTRTAVEDAALSLVARTLLFAAAERAESRGAHVRLDYPDTDDARFARSQEVRLDVSGRPIATRLESARSVA
ncbi:L-aspartate oxidase [Tamaricihabitans halophyticus]|uniref:L-aspartate oxidase n=1 Tax=Tamaricihabitans halophyticus TaxID=1262583 RepID=A0A4R2Q987_9PSEU|nr:L-aspartate oxidase [Tamaricihabitans halophyticus]TCP45452.1 L-aspartate oxidase [Tamaricihabitans halophyticus]